MGERTLFHRLLVERCTDETHSQDDRGANYGFRIACEDCVAAALATARREEREKVLKHLKLAGYNIDVEFFMRALGEGENG